MRESRSGNVRLDVAFEITGLHSSDSLSKRLQVFAFLSNETLSRPFSSSNGLDICEIAGGPGRARKRRSEKIRFNSASA
jgi:hypothetical protein